MISFTPWTIPSDENLRRSRIERASRGDDLPPLPNDGRWAAAIHRWAERDAVSAESREQAARQADALRAQERRLASSGPGEAAPPPADARRAAPSW